VFYSAAFALFYLTFPNALAHPDSLHTQYRKQNFAALRDKAGIGIKTAWPAQEKRRIPFAAFVLV
jgi:hypothetical protein